MAPEQARNPFRPTAGAGPLSSSCSTVGIDDELQVLQQHGLVLALQSAEAVARKDGPLNHCLSCAPSGSREDPVSTWTAVVWANEGTGSNVESRNTLMRVVPPRRLRARIVRD